MIRTLLILAAILVVALAGCFNDGDRKYRNHLRVDTQEAVWAAAGSIMYWNVEEDWEFDDIRYMLCKVADGEYAPDLMLGDVLDSPHLRLAVYAYCLREGGEEP